MTMRPAAPLLLHIRPGTVFFRAWSFRDVRAEARVRRERRARGGGKKKGAKGGGPGSRAILSPLPPSTAPGAPGRALSGAARGGPRACKHLGEGCRPNLSGRLRDLSECVRESTPRARGRTSSRIFVQVALR